MKKCKLCPYRKTCKDECYGENPCSFAKAFDALGKKLDLKTVCIESLRSQRDEALAKAPEHRIVGDYVLTPIRNAFNEKTSWWLTKKGYVLALYCFTGTDPKEVERQIGSLGQYTDLLDRFSSARKINECVYDIALVAQHMIEEHSIEVEDSRELFDNILEWAWKFEAGFTEEQDAAGDYMEYIEEFAEGMLRERYGTSKLKLKVVLDEPVDLARCMIEDLGNGNRGHDRWSCYFGMARANTGSESATVSVALGEMKHNLGENEWHYALHVINDVDDTDCELYYTDHLSEEELVALLKSLAEQMEKGEI